MICIYQICFIIDSNRIELESLNCSICSGFVAKSNIFSMVIYFLIFPGPETAAVGPGKNLCRGPPPPGITHAQKIRKYNFPAQDTVELHAKGFHGTGFFFP